MTSTTQPEGPVNRRQGLGSHSLVEQWRYGFGDLRWRDLAVVSTLVAIYLLVQALWLLRGMPLAGGDQLDYFSIVGGFQDISATHRHLRIGLTLPVQLSVSIFGYSQAGYYAVPVLAGVVFIVSVYLLGRFLAGSLVGSLAAVAATFNAHMFWESSHLLPDLLASGLFTLSVGLVGALRRQTSYRYLIILGVAGFILGWSYLVREFMILFFPVVLFAVWQSGKRWRELGVVALGAASAWAIELIYGGIVLGAPLARLAAVVGRGQPTLDVAARQQGSQEAQQSILETAWILPEQLLSRDGGWLLASFATITLLGLITAFATGRWGLVRALAVPVVWFIVGYGSMTFFGWTVTDDGRPIIRMSKVRYWTPIFPPMAVGGAIALVAGGHWVFGARRTFLIIAASFAIILVTVPGYRGLDSLSHSASYLRNGGNLEFQEFRAWLADDGSDYGSIVVDSGHGRALDRILPAFARTRWGTPVWNGSWQRHDVNGPFRKPESGGAIAMQSESNQYMSQRDQLPSYALTPPDTWTAAFVASNGKLAVLAEATEFYVESPLHETHGDGQVAAPISESMPTLGGSKGASIRLVSPEPPDEVIGRLLGYRIEITGRTAGDARVSVSCLFEELPDGGESQEQSAFAPDQTGSFPAIHYCVGPTAPTVVVRISEEANHATARLFEGTLTGGR